MPMLTPSALGTVTTSTPVSSPFRASEVIV